MCDRTLKGAKISQRLKCAIIECFFFSFFNFFTYATISSFSTLSLSLQRNNKNIARKQLPGRTPSIDCADFQHWFGSSGQRSVQSGPVSLKHDSYIYIAYMCVHMCALKYKWHLQLLQFTPLRRGVHNAIYICACACVHSSLCCCTPPFVLRCSMFVQHIICVEIATLHINTHTHTHTYPCMCKHAFIALYLMYNLQQPGSPKKIPKRGETF